MLQAGEVSDTELRATAAEAIERVDPALHAVVAPLLDRAVPGVPMLLKDAGQEIAGTPHWVGVAALRDAEATSTRTTELVARFERAGFGVVGKAACPQLSTGATTEPHGFAPTRNPWDLSRSPGGSSGGPAAAVAAGLVPVAHGSDATGSLRAPAALCGVATLVPSARRIPGVPPAGQPPNDAWRDFVIARHAEDLALLFELLTGDAAAPPPHALRVGLLDHDPELGAPVHPACAHGVHLAGSLIEALGHVVASGWPAALDSLWATSSAHFGIVSDATRPPILTWVSERLGRPVERGELDDTVFEAAGRAARRTDAEVTAARQAIDVAVAPITTWWDTWDLLVTPTTFQPAWPLGTEAGPREMGTLLAPFSLTGQPALSLPLHRTDDGLPVGVQIVGRHGSDATLLGLAQQLQECVDWTRHRPEVP
jgi:amidase